MSNSETPSNNKLPRPPSPLRGDSEEKCTRHPVYYYKDGSTVFQAGVHFFKFQASLLKADAGVQGYKFEEIMKRRLESSYESENEPGSSDLNPIILPVSSRRFETLIFAVFGRASDPAIASLLAAPDGLELEEPTFLVDYLEIGVMASYFGMRSLESWAQSKVLDILESGELVAPQEWPDRYLQRLSAYLQTTDLPELQHGVLVFIQLLFSLASPDLPEPLNDDPMTRFLACAELYQTETLATSNPSLFGFVFVIILSLGHRSSVWAENLIRDERVILYAASLDLTRLSNHTDLQLEWLKKSTQVMDLCSTTGICPQTFNNIWNKTFAHCGRLDSAVPFEDIKQILTLPKLRFAFAKECSKWYCQSECAQKSLDKIDAAIRETFCGFTKKHKDFIRNI